MSGWGATVVGLGRILSLLDDIQVRFDDDVVYVVGTNVEYGVYLETGTSKMQAYPWFRPAVREYKRNPAAFIAKNTETSLSRVDSVGELVKTVAFALEAQMKKNVSAKRASGRSPGTHPDHPQRQDANLVNSIKAEQIR